jgi:hypothetical protein
MEGYNQVECRKRVMRKEIPATGRRSSRKANFNVKSVELPSPDYRKLTKFRNEQYEHRHFLGKERKADKSNWQNTAPGANDIVCPAALEGSGGCGFDLSFAFRMRSTACSGAVFVAEL